MEDPVTSQTNTSLNEELLEFFKALSDANRLKILGLLASRPHTVEQLAAALNLGASTVSHHLSRLSDAGLVSAKAESYYSVYSLQTNQLEEMSRRLLKTENVVKLAEDVDIEAFDRKVIRDFMGADGRFKALPSQEKKLIALLRYMLKGFEPNQRYAEKEVNEILKQYHDDFASLRRAMIEYKFMARESGIYWLI